MHQSHLCSMPSHTPQVGQEPWEHRPRFIILHFKWLLQEEDSWARAVPWIFQMMKGINPDIFFSSSSSPSLPHTPHPILVCWQVFLKPSAPAEVLKKHEINPSSFPHVASICSAWSQPVPVPEPLSHQESPRAQPWFTASQHHTSAPCHPRSTKAHPSHS